MENSQTGIAQANGNDKETPAARFLHRAFYALLLISGAATFMGLYELMQAGRTDVAISSIAYSAIVVAVMISIMGAAAEISVGSLRYRFGTKFRILAAVAYFVTALFAVSLAFAFWWEALAASNATQTEVEDQIATVEQNLRETRGILSAATTQLDLAASLSTERSADEDTKGGTCSTTQKGYGPAAKTRAAHAALLGNVRDYSNKRLVELDDKIGKSQTKIANLRKRMVSSGEAERVRDLKALGTTLTELSDQTKALASDPGLTSFRKEMRNVAAAYRKPSGHAGGVTCLDAGMASAIEGAEQTLGKLGSIDPPKFGIYSGNKATMEALARFYRTTFWFLSLDGAGLSELDERIAYAICWLIDLGLFGIVWLRASLSIGSKADFKMQRIKQDIAEEKLLHAANALRIEHWAECQQDSLDTLSDKNCPPFLDLMISFGGRRYIVVPKDCPDAVHTALAQQMIAILDRLDKEKGSGVREQLLRSGTRRFSGWTNDRRARRQLAQICSDRWVTGSNFVWYKISDQALQSLAIWVRLIQRNEAAKAVKQRHTVGSLGAKLSEYNWHGNDRSHFPVAPEPMEAD